MGPSLWDLFYGKLLELQMPEGITLVRFADDVAIIVVAGNAELIEQVANPALQRVADWMAKHGLKVAP